MRYFYIAAAIALAACDSPTQPKADIWASEGDTIQISIPENPSTGYRWRIEGATICDSAGYSYEQEVRPGDIEKNICGRGGKATYFFIGRESGTDTISFLCERFKGDSVVEKKTYVIGFTEK